ncbi:MAG TPA: branched-chain amino acid ABC transporter permease [Mycobacteriales bacterium]|nr:branched-chain amino acid ABC transporter permease [Mycobacteriales bacterium]
MGGLAQVLVLGLISGSIYALFALGVVLIHRGTGVLTFGGGEVGTAAIFLAAFLVDGGVIRLPVLPDIDLPGMPWAVGALGAITLAVGIGLLFERLVVRPMVGRDPVSVSVATVGLGLFLLSLEFRLFGESPQQLAGPVDAGFTVAGVIVSPTQVVGLVLALALGFGLQAALRRTDFGLGILAAAQDPDAVRLVGVPLARISMTIWAAGAALAGVAALLVAPTVGAFGPGYASELYVIGLAAAVVGGLNSLPGAVVGGVALGIATSAGTRWLSGLDLPGLQYLIVLAVLLLVLLGRQTLPDLLRRLEPPTPQPAPTPTEARA